MAEAVISTVANKFSGYLLQESSLLYGVRDEVEWLERELRGILCFLKDAPSKKKENDERVKIWVRDIIDVAYDAEDVIETFMLEADNLTPKGSFELMLTRCSPTARFENFMLTIGRCFPIFTCIVSHYRVGRDNIENLKTRINEISERKAELGIFSLDETGGQGSSSIYENLQGTRRFPPQYDDSYIVGFGEDKKNIVKKLLNDDKRLCLISIVGMGGIGKTTLAKNIFDSNEVIKEFDAYFWISVSQEYRVPELLKKMVEEVTGSERADRLQEEYLKRDLYEALLSQGRYLIVMDDVWDKEVWVRILTALPDKRNGSRVLFTTHNIDIARCADPAVTPYELPFLNEEQSRRLFLRKVYPNQNVEAFPKDLKIVGQNLVEKCQGLPLSLVVLGGFLSLKEKNHHQWSSVLNSLNWESTEVGGCLGVLYFSYEALPHYLKPCFLYLDSFPKISEISAKRLMRLWIAEGFVPPKPRDTREETAEAFLEELAARYMIQVAGRRWDGRIKKIRIHDHLRDLCIREAREYGFLHFQSSYVERKQSISSSIEMTRRLALHAIKPKNYLNRSGKKWRTPNLRTLHFIFSGVLGHLSFNGLKLLRVIDMKTEYSWTELPKEISSLIHLRYFRWRGGPAVDYQLIKSLHKLQTLDVFPFVVETDASISNFKDLQFLSQICAGLWIERGLAKLTNLQKLVVSTILDSHWDALIRSLKKLHRLVRLTLKSHSPVPTQVISMFSHQHPLRHLTVHGALSKLPKSRAFPPNLTNLTLCLSFLEQDPMPTLKELPNLICLKLLDSSYHGKTMHCQAGGFTQLRHLVLRYMTTLENWKVDVGALPSLSHLTIDTCDYLRMLPKGLQHVTTLQELKLLGMPSDFITILKGKDRYKIKHIRYIYC